MHFDVAALSAAEVYKLMCAMVVPRPIALITSLGADGVLNAAPFSYFNVMGTDPPVVAIGIGNRSADSPKDTARNIRDRGEFVVHIVDEAMGAAMNLCATDFPPDMSEVEATGLTPAPSMAIDTPRLAEAPFAFECRHVSNVEIGRTRIVLGQVVTIWARDGLVDPARKYVQTEEAHVIGRMHGRGWYTRTGDLFEMERVSFAAWRAGRGE